jgi:hypothetical protein
MSHVISHVRRVWIGDDIPTVFDYFVIHAMIVGGSLIAVGP